MTSTAKVPLTIVGAEGSPYSRKMRAVLRYRRIPHRWIARGSREDRDLPEPPVALIPVFVFPGEDWARIDSTPLIRELERRHEGRSVLPPDPVVAFVDELIEDYADEWVTKMMFHFRWAFAPDVEKAGTLLPLLGDPGLPEEQHARMKRLFSERQVARLGLVGSNETTAPVIEESYRRLLDRLDSLLREQRFVMGGRPGASDFALFGQLSQLVGFDPTSAAVAFRRSPRTVAWCSLVEDLSGVEAGDDDWIRRDAVPGAVRALLTEIGRGYAPFLVANAAALERGDDTVECEIDGRRWNQGTFRYQGKCLRWLRDSYGALTPSDRADVDRILSGTGCEVLFKT